MAPWFIPLAPTMSSPATAFRFGPVAVSVSDHRPSDCSKITPPGRALASYRFLASATAESTVLSI